jgi:biotin carboxyl carrier protein
MNYKIAIKDKKFDVEIGEIRDGLAQVTVDHKPFEVKIENYAEIVPSAAAPAAPKPAPAPRPVTVAPAPAPKPAPVSASADGNVISAPISGLILNVMVKAGDTVSAGQVVATLEAMKMENSIVSNVAGTVKEIRVQKGAEVATGDVLMVIG